MGSASREFEMSHADFEKIRMLIARHAGISLAPVKRDLVYSRIARRVRSLGLVSFNHYTSYLEQTPAETEFFVNALTTNLTSFFREPHHFTTLGEFVRDHQRRSRPLRVWSAACSTGEEPYSIAITLRETTPPDVSAKIYATDIDTHVLQRAKDGVYPIHRVTALGPQRLRRFFDRGVGGKRGLVRVRDEIRELVTFEHVNLLDTTWPIVEGEFDVVFCRNVLIYFDHPTQRMLLTRIAAMLPPDGLLMTGHSEVLLRVPDLFTMIGKTTYRKTTGGPTARPGAAARV